MKKVVIAAFAWVALCAIGQADVKLPALFSDNMVLQQGMKVPVWGWADDGEKVTVEFEGQKVEAAAQGGAWKAELDALKAGGPFELKVSGKNTIAIKNVLVGEVWVCGGQSNMGLAVSACENADKELAASENPRIRLFKVAQAAADEPAKDVKAQWAEAGPSSVAPFSATGYFFGRALQKALNCPVGLIESCVGGTNASSWVSHAVLAGDPILKTTLDAYEESLKKYAPAKAAYDKKVADWKESVKKEKAAGKTPAAMPKNLRQGPMGPDNAKRPSGFYNGMIKPLQPYAVKGAIWYQGEANSGDPEHYKTLLPALIKNWRDDWGEGDFPFLLVQLPGYDPGQVRFWPLFREAQAEIAAKTKNTGMAVAIDVGEKTNIHPKKKQPVGERLSRVARVMAYGEKTECCGPMYDSMKADGAKAVISFKHTDGGLEAKGGTLKGFVIAGEDKAFVDATAEIVGDTVVVSSPKVEKPVAVRYAWAQFPECNLYNKESLPAAPFRTDDWTIEQAAASRPAPKAAAKAGPAAKTAPAAKAGPSAKAGATAKAGAKAKAGPTAKAGATVKAGPTAKVGPTAKPGPTAKAGTE